MTNKAVPTVPSLLPSNSTPLEKALEQACAGRCEQLNLNLSALYNADECPLVLLPWLAWAYHVPTWEKHWSEAQKRDAIKQAVLINRKKGTPWAVKAALRTAQIEANLIEWWQTAPKGEPYTFETRIWLNEQPAGLFGDAALYPRLFQLVDEYKNVRSHYDVKIGAKFTQTLAPQLFSKQSARSNSTAQVKPVPIRDSRAALGISLSSAQSARSTQTAQVKPVPVRDAVITPTIRMFTQFRARLTMTVRATA